MKITDYKNIQSVDELEEIADDQLDTNSSCSCNSQKTICTSEERANTFWSNMSSILITSSTKSIQE